MFLGIPGLILIFAGNRGLSVGLDGPRFFIVRLTVLGHKSTPYYLLVFGPRETFFVLWLSFGFWF